jgi:DNA repair exonuclease SbcCD ATPase subunit
MLKRTKDAVQAAVETILPPSVAAATKAAEDRRAALVDAQKSVADGEAELEALYDRGAPAVELHAAEAKIADAKLNADRAQRVYTAAEKRLTKAQDAERERGMAEGLKRADEVLAERDEIADEIAAALDALRAGIARMDAADERLSVLQAAGHITSHPTFGWGATRTQLGAATEDLLSGTTAPRVVPFAAWVESQNSCARIQQNSERAA